MRRREWASDFVVEGRMVFAGRGIQELEMEAGIDASLFT